MEIKEELIPEFERDSSLDHVIILKSLMEIPFSVGKTLLADFLTGNSRNASIVKNDLTSLRSFGSLRRDKEGVMELIEKMIKYDLIQVSPTAHNSFIKTLRITKKGENQIINPGKLSQQEEVKEFNFKEEAVTEDDKKIFSEVGQFMIGYNEEQMKAVIDPSEKIICIAGAGGGKTSVLTKRIEFLVRYKGVKPENVLAITFTRKAREEMNFRLLKHGINVQVETFNSFCEKILRKHYSQIYGKPMRMFTYMEKVMAVMSALNNLDLDLKHAIDIYFSESQKNNKVFDELSGIFVQDCFLVLEYFKTTNKFDDKHFVEVNKKLDKDDAKSILFNVALFLREYMEVQGLRDYLDQIIDVVNFFKTNKEAIPEFEHILIDEYQDVNSMQNELIELLNPRNLFCVGDPRQAIFGWRGAELGYIMDFNKRYPNAKTIVLKKNYRSSKQIVEFMNSLAKDTGMPYLDSSVGNNGSLNLFPFESEQEEFNFITNKILELNIDREEIFVLARTNRQLNDLAKVLKNKGITYSLRTDEQKKPVTSKKGEVVLATIHAIKGMEAKVVFVIGCNDTYFPSKSYEHPALSMLKTNDYDKESEEKRLFYVAVSRAKNELYLSYSGKNFTYFINDEMLSLINHNSKK